MTNKDLDKFKELIAAGGYRLTTSREETFNALINPEPQSISELITKTSGKVDRVSVYRNIELFEKLGIVNRISIGWKYKLELSDKFMVHHHHLSCLGCGKTIDIEDEQHIEAFILQVSKREGFTPRSHVFEIDGYCDRCNDSGS